MGDAIRVRELGCQPYQATWQEMQLFTQQRTAETVDEIWVVEHPPVFTLGRNGRPEHLLHPGAIPVISTDRGGQVTYHGPGQLVVYLLIDIRRRSIGVRALVSIIEKTIIHYLAENGIKAYARADAPGVYVNDAKIAALGLRIKNGSSFHGLSLNVDMDLSPFSQINPCGYEGMAVTQLKDLMPNKPLTVVANELVSNLVSALGGHVVNRENGGN